MPLLPFRTRKQFPGWGAFLEKLCFFSGGGGSETQENLRRFLSRNSSRLFSLFVWGGM